MDKTDSQWRRFGELDPYFGVLSHKRFHKERLTDQSIAEFFRSGEEDISRTFDFIRFKVDPNFAPKRSLDFGCGVGRLLPALATRSEAVVGYDISPGMLAEARKNCTAANISLSPSIEGQFDFIHSRLVFQHIAPRRGEKILADLLKHLRGVGAIHFTYRSRHSLLGKWARFLRRLAPFPLNGLWNLAQGRSFSYPWMRLSVYNLSRVLAVLRDAGCHAIQVLPCDQGAMDGCIFFFKHD